MENQKKNDSDKKSLKIIKKQRDKLKNKILSDNYSEDDIKNLNILDLNLKSIQLERISKIDQVKDLVKEYEITISELFSKAQIRKDENVAIVFKNKLIKANTKTEKSESSKVEQSSETDSRKNNLDASENKNNLSKASPQKKGHY